MMANGSDSPLSASRTIPWTVLVSWARAEIGVANIKPPTKAVASQMVEAFIRLTPQNETTYTGAVFT